MVGRYVAYNSNVNIMIDEDVNIGLIVWEPKVVLKELKLG